MKAGVLLVLMGFLLLWVSAGSAQEGAGEIGVPTVGTPLAAPATPTAVMESWPRLICDDCFYLPLVIVVAKEEAGRAATGSIGGK
ncbi:MAG: hypothetical protein D6706_05790 [Chloroflexi bacterium]|nr:MAG: hypothetical protein D6706_05790 [Chloroflexota bacterium]